MLETSKGQVYHSSQRDKFYTKEVTTETERMWINRKKAIERSGKMLTSDAIADILGISATNS